MSENSLYENLLKIPLPPKIERFVYDTAFNDDIFDVAQHDADLDAGKVIDDYTEYLRGEEGWKILSHEIIEKGMLYTGCFFITHNILDICDEAGIDPSDLVSRHDEEEDGPLREAYKHSEWYPMVGFLRFRITNLFKTTKSTDVPSVHSIYDYIVLFDEYNDRKIRGLRDGLYRYYVLREAIEDGTASEEEEELEEEFFEITDKMSFRKCAED